MRDFNENTLTEAALARLEGCTDARTKTLMTALIRHLHDFVRETALTEKEWFAAIQFLTATGQKCDDKRQEFILLSDVLGVSMLVDALAHRKPPGATESTVFGPFHVEGAPELPLGADIRNGAPGERLFMYGRVLDLNGRPIEGAVLDIWQTDGDGWYDSQLPDVQGMQARGKIASGADGEYRFWSVKPVSYAIPTDGPVGAVLRMQGRHPYRPAHVHMIVSAAGFDPVTTHVFVNGDPYLDSDAVFGVKASLVADFVAQPGGTTAPDGSTPTTPYWTCRYDFTLADAG